LNNKSFVMMGKPQTFLKSKMKLTEWQR